MPERLRIATRKSPLALWQAEEVARRLKSLHPTLTIELMPLSTRGDQLLSSPLAKIGGKGLFVKELEHALLQGEADIAVHSMKDVPVDFPENLGLAVILEREDPRDAFVSNTYAHPSELPAKAVVGSSSLRRQMQILSHYPRLRLQTLRGNVHTRLAKLDAGEYDAILLAAAGLKRLGLGERIRSFLTPEESLPAIGQGALGIETRLEDERILDLLAPLEHPETRLCVNAERALNTRLNGGCQVPIAAYAQMRDGKVHMRALIGMPDGSETYRAEASSEPAEAEALGTMLAEHLLAQGADRVLHHLGILPSTDSPKTAHD